MDFAPKELLGQLLAFASVSRTPNLSLIGFVRDLLATHGIASTLVPDETGTKANLFASVGPTNRPGILLSGHTDVVPTEGQHWTVPPFEMTERDDKLFGRGSADMKGFVACAVLALVDASKRTLTTPLQLALSYDEEIGCVGVRRLLDMLESTGVRPSLCVVGEPTSMQIATGHKGKTALRAICRGVEAHSALAPNYANAVHLGCDMVQAVRDIQARVAREGSRDEAYDVPYSTLHVGRLSGGTALNIVPNRCEIDFEIRSLADDDPTVWIAELRERARHIAAQARTSPLNAPVDIELEIVNAYPGLDTSPTSHAVSFIESLLPPQTMRTKVAFGTEGGLFTRHLAAPVVVCGPGSISVAHKPDEYVEIDQLRQCETFLARLSATLTA